jgi:hypothetical protein
VIGKSGEPAIDLSILPSSSPLFLPGLIKCDSPRCSLYQARDILDRENICSLHIWLIGERNLVTDPLQIRIGHSSLIDRADNRVQESQCDHAGRNSATKDKDR